MRFEELYEEHYLRVYRFARSLCGEDALAEDIAQQTFMKAWMGFSQFKGQCSLATWLCAIAKNEYVTSLRKRGKDIGQLSMDIADPGPGLEAALINQQNRLRIHKLLHQMEEPYREVFTLRLFGELSHGEIAALFNKTETWARTIYYRAKSKLQERMRNENG